MVSGDGGQGATSRRPGQKRNIIQLFMLPRSPKLEGDVEWAHRSPQPRRIVL